MSGERGLRDLGAVFPSDWMKNPLVEMLKRSMERGVVDAVMIPMRVPAGDSYAYILVSDPLLLEEADPLPPVISVQGGKALSSLTRRGSDIRIAAVMRPCEARAAIELSKLGQVDLDSMVIITQDCPGALPLRRFVRDPESGLKAFDRVVSGDDGDTREICRICESRNAVVGDLHLGTLTDDGDPVMMSNTPRGDEIMEGAGMTMDREIVDWMDRVSDRMRERARVRRERLGALRKEMGGADGFLRVFQDCIDCHNCMRVCPVCYCRLCYFDSRRMRHPAQDHLDLAERRGAMRLPPDTALFHLGRMSHMSLTCVSCGACEDACPASIPVARLFAAVADSTQASFGYASGRSPDEPLPLVVYREEELHEVDGE